jgi:cysteine desulfurase / selenocysteine lyase
VQFDALSIRRQCPLLAKSSVAYLDSAATCQKPQAVLDAMTQWYETSNANVNRGVYPLAEAATIAYEAARNTVAEFIGGRPHEIVFTKNATEGVNLVARSFGESLKAGDGIALTVMEHHSNIVPWLQLKERKKISVEWVTIDSDGQPDLLELEAILKKGKTKLIAITGLSNVLGVMPDLKKVTALGGKYGARTFVDASQLVAHAAVDVAAIGCDFLVFSGHKLYGPTGIGVLWGKSELLESMPPFLGGGDMIRTVTKDGFTPAELPRKFEAGTPPAAEAVGLAAAITWLQKTGVDAVHAHEAALINTALRELSSVKKLTILGPADAAKHTGCVSFTLAGVHPHDLTEVLGQKGFCLRAGHHCTQPLHDYLKISASARLSVAAYNTTDEIMGCMAALKEAQKLLTK